MKKIFISWSGDRSNLVAQALNSWLKKVVQSVDPFISTDMERGVRWMNVVNENLDEHDFGILCVTPENTQSVWLNYEAGALSKHLGTTGRLIPYALGFENLAKLKPPLSQYNAAKTDRQGTLQLVKTLNLGTDNPLADDVIQDVFQAFWPELDAKLTAIAEMNVAGSSVASRSVDDMVEEALTLLRNLTRVQETSNMAAAEETWASTGSGFYSRFIHFDQSHIDRQHQVADICKRFTGADPTTIDLNPSRNKVLISFAHDVESQAVADIMNAIDNELGIKVLGIISSPIHLSDGPFRQPDF